MRARRVVSRALSRALSRDFLALPVISRDWRAESFKVFNRPLAFERAVAANPAAAGVAAADVRDATLGFAVGKAAIAMARAAGPIPCGLVVSPHGTTGALPPGWTGMTAGHPEPDDASVAAGAAVRALVESAGPDDVVLALISGGASALIEQPRVPLAEFRARIAAVMAGGAAIAELNAARTALSELKGGQLARLCRGRIVTLVASDVVGDRLDVIGSGPTIPPRAQDRAELVAPLAAFAQLIARELGVRVVEPALVGDVADVARRIAGEPGAFVAYGEPTLCVPVEHGEGGRAQQLALLLARELRGTERSALVAGSDGIDGPPPRGRPAPAGAFVDGTTWDRLADPEGALARCDAGNALAQIGALFVTGPTHVNHADVVIVG